MELTLSVEKLTRKDCAALASLLQDPGSNLTTLRLVNIRFDDEAASILVTGLATNTTLTELEIEFNYS